MEENDIKEAPHGAREQHDAEFDRRMRISQLYVGAGLFLAVLGVHAFVRELPILFLAIPGLAMGLKLDSFISGFGSKK